MKNTDLTKKQISALATKHKWTFCDYQENIQLLSFVKTSKDGDQMRINIYLTKLTVGTALNHPKHGKTQLFRKKCSVSDIEKILLNPRAHTNKGYYNTK